MSNIIQFPSEYVKKSENVYKPYVKVVAIDKKIIRATNDLIKILERSGYCKDELKQIFKLGNGIFNS